jgi:hypothetical protein
MTTKKGKNSRKRVYGKELSAKLNAQSKKVTPPKPYLINILRNESSTDVKQIEI